MAKRTTPKKTDLEKRFEEAKDERPDGATIDSEEPIQIPARPAQIKVQAINEDNLLFTFIADNGMSVNNFTVPFEQISAIVEGMAPWLKAGLDRLMERRYDNLTVVQRDNTLVGPDGAPLSSGQSSNAEES